MRTFEELKDLAIKEFLAQIHRAETGQIKLGNKEQFINDRQTQIDNAEECTTIDIGQNANYIIHQIQELYNGNHQKEYFENFNGLISNQIINRPGSAYALGIKLEDLQMFRGKNPFSDEVCDEFRRLVNFNYGTQIPMASEVRQAQKDYEELRFKGSEREQAEVYCKYMEIARDAGELKNGGTYYPLATNKFYQEQKSLCTEKKL